MTVSQPRYHKEEFTRYGLDVSETVLEFRQ